MKRDELEEKILLTEKAIIFAGPSIGGIWKSI